MEKKLVVASPRETGIAKVTKEDITKYFCPLASETEVFMALGIINSLNLNPFKKEVHLIKYSKEKPISIVVGYEVCIKRAERTGKLDGWEVGITDDSKKAWVRIHRKDWKIPFYWEVDLSEFDKKQSTWNQIPSFMGKKVAIAQGFRLAFPDELGGMPYTQEEYEVYDVAGASTAAKPSVDMPQRKSEAKPAPVQEKLTAEDVAAEFDGQVEKEYITIAEAIKVKVGGLFHTRGTLVRATQRKPKDNTITTYTITDETGEIAISVWGEVIPGAKTGAVLGFTNVQVSEYKGTMQRTAQEVNLC